MLNTVLTIIFYLILPVFVLRLCAINAFLNKIGPILLCYLVGFIVGQIPFFSQQQALLDLITTLTIPLALPLLLFQLNLKNWGKLAKGAVISMCCAIVALLVALTISYIIFKNHIPENWKVAGLLVGLYTGGTPNIASIQQALLVNKETYIALHTIDIVLGAIFILLTISVAHPLLIRWLPKFKNNNNFQEQEEKPQQKSTLKQWLAAPSYKSIAISLLMAILTAALGAAAGLLVTDQSLQMAVTILGITTAAILASLVPVIKKQEWSYSTGMYIILIFSTAVASMADFTKVLAISSSLAAFIACVMFGTIALHLLLNKLFKIDADTTMVTSTALICSPPFVPVVCGAIKNKQVMLSGISVGIIGYCIGNYLGIGIAYLLKNLTPF